MSLIRKRPPLVGHPVRFRIFRVPSEDPKTDRVTHEEGPFSDQVHCSRKENSEATSNFQVAAVPPASRVHIRDRETMR